ncbi:hypothetical protein [Lysobacter solisilvae (ex Woo and Kim 2020)]|uniref:Peptidoglycan-binding protein n=1 Tax=Agrilutibacter terrestris TaxID=2865112 RepID=A0A7H0FZR0_9GAMM|nr:hypothetical protein [Lysobacter terrestris]QNP41526.1 hypothetical protein H8B22_04755 [Lysobacter terrestris]
MKPFVMLLAVLVMARPESVVAQAPNTSPAPAGDPQPQAQIAAPAVDAATPAAVVECCRVPAGSLVELEIAQVLSSSALQRGDKFAIRLHAPLLHEGVVVIPAGTVGEGEVVHADRSRGGGKPGELLIAARYLEFDGARIPLRALKFGGQGQDKSNVALGVALAVGPFAHFVHGKEIEIPAGTIVNAKLAQDLPLPVAASTPSTASATPAAPTAIHQE